MNIVFSTLCLNEMEWLPKLYQQHKDWPGLAKWVFVESADVAYATANPHLVSQQGLSVDGTSEYLCELAATDDRITYIPFGYSKHHELAQGKCAARQQSIDVAHQIKPDVFFVLDADEFYTSADQVSINSLMARYFATSFYTAIRFRQVSPWHPPSLGNLPLFSYQVVGGFWKMAHCHIWKYNPTMCYSANHNHPCDSTGRDLCCGTKALEGDRSMPMFVHMACAANVAMRHAKNAYYRERGEGRNDRRGWYVESRAAFETWQPGDLLPGGAKVVHYDEAVPEVFNAIL